ncbi:MAG TPA: CRISPR-associated endonuclease Cas2 [Verrucomicrobiae bacterium]|nr:CRISPR-associated endonuclease Cas2 [Verrucomicrobiae bacterium]
MTIVITYDVETKTPGGRRRLRRVAQACLDYGQRVQFSVFEVTVNETKWTMLRQRLLTEADLTKDSLRFYFLGEDAAKRTEHHGTKPSIDYQEPLIA